MIQKRGIGLSILLTIVTCGIYGIVWFVSLTDDIKRASGDESLPSGGIAFLLTLVTCGIYGIYWAYKMGKALQQIQTNAGVTAAADNSILYLILQIIGLGIVNYALMQNTLNSVATNGGNYAQPMNGNMPNTNNPAATPDANNTTTDSNNGGTVAQ